MIDGFIQKKQRRHVQDLNIVPILDMLTTVIFFLLMSTSFIEFTKHTVPPSATATVSGEASEPPRTPKMFLVNSDSNGGKKLQLVLRWSGKTPGEKTADLELGSDPKSFRDALAKASGDLATEFAAKYPDDKTLQIGMSPGLPYQALISLMDGVRPVVPDLVLISYADAEAQAQSRSSEAK